MTVSELIAQLAALPNQGASVRLYDSGHNDVSDLIGIAEVSSYAKVRVEGRETEMRRAMRLWCKPSDVVLYTTEGWLD